MIVPVKQDKGLDISMAFFINAGSLWGLGNTATEVNDSNLLRVSIGVGIIINTPMLPIRLDFALPIQKEEYDKEQYTSFSMATRL